MVGARASGHGHRMTQQSRKPRRYALSIALFGLGVALLIAEQNAGIAWTVIVGSFALAASPTGDAASDERKTRAPARRVSPSRSRAR
jgi:hypothetical protein